MAGGSISLVHRESIPRFVSIQLDHDVVAGDLGNDRGGGDAQAACVSVDNSDLRLRQFGHCRIQQNRIWFDSEVQNGSFHRDPVGGPQSKLVKLWRFNHAQTDGGRNVEHDLEPDFSLRGCVQLGVAKTIQAQYSTAPTSRQHHCRGNQRASQRPAANFINSGNSLNAVFPPPSFGIECR